MCSRKMGASFNTRMNTGWWLIPVTKFPCSVDDFDLYTGTPKFRKIGRLEREKIGFWISRKIYKRR